MSCQVSHDSGAGVSGAGGGVGCQLNNLTHFVMDRFHIFLKVSGLLWKGLNLRINVLSVKEKENFLLDSTTKCILELQSVPNLSAAELVAVLGLFGDEQGGVRCSVNSRKL